MNKERRKSLNAIIDGLEELKEELEAEAEDEEEYFENIPENLRGSERYEIAEQACEYLREAIGNIEESITNIGEAL